MITRFLDGFASPIGATYNVISDTAPEQYGLVLGVLFLVAVGIFAVYKIVMMLDKLFDDGSGPL